MTTEEQKAYDEALRRIEACRRKGKSGARLELSFLGLSILPPQIGQLSALTELYISDNLLKTLPLEIGNLSSLTELNLGSNLLRKLPPKIGQLSSLTQLYLGNNKLRTLPPEIGKLSALTSLYLGGNELRTMPPAIGELSALMHLDLGGNQLNALPPAIGELSTLKGLYLMNNQLSSLPPEIGKLSALVELYLHDNQLSNLPPFIGELFTLTGLYLMNNQLSTLPPEIGKLSALTELHLNGNQLSTLPSEISNLSALKLLFLHENPGLKLPEKLLGPKWHDVVLKQKPAISPKEILDYYFTHQRTAERVGTQPLLEAKILVLGEANVGKTSLVAALAENKRRVELAGKGTSGIARKLWEVRVAGEGLAPQPEPLGAETLRLNCWDFGGQEIYHSAHTLFMTVRAVYLIVISKRDNERQNNTDYWLRMAASFGGPDAVVYLVVNMDDEKVGHPPDGEALKRRHPQLRGILTTSCDDLSGIQEARRVIVREALALQGVRQPVARTWLKFKNELEKMTTPTLSMQDWENLCGDGVATPDERRELLHLCDWLGTVRYFPTTPGTAAPELCDTAILNPEWVTLGIYAILDDEDLKKRGGLLDRAQMTNILNSRGYPQQGVRVIEEVMRRYDLLYDSRDHGLHHRMLIPLMLPEFMPAIPGSAEDSLEFIYEYVEVMPAGLIPAFIARQHTLLSKRHASWRHGCVLEILSCLVRVIGDAETKKVSISVNGPETSRREALDQVRFTFQELHRTVDNLRVKQLIPVPGYREAPLLDYEHMRALDWKDVRTYEAPGAGFAEIISVDVRQVLRGVRGTQGTKQDEEKRLAVINHYHHYTPGNQPKFMNDDHSISIGRDNYGQVGQTLTNCTNLIQQMQPGELKVRLETLTEQLVPVRDEMKVRDAKEIDAQLTTLVEEAQKPEKERDRGLLSVTAQGLIEAAQTVGEIATPVIATVKAILQLLGISAG